MRPIGKYLIPVTTLTIGLLVGGALVKYWPLELISRPPRVMEIAPDQFTFAHRPDSPIWIAFDQTMDSSTITNDTVIVKVFVAGEELLVNGTIYTGERMLMFRPDGWYPGWQAPGDRLVVITLIGTDRGSGVIKSALGVTLDGDRDGNPGGDYVYEYTILG